MMSEQEFIFLQEKIKREFPIRLKLAKLAGIQTRPLIEFDHTIIELMGIIAACVPQHNIEAKLLFDSLLWGKIK